jgi:hypothetical protein
MRPQRAFCLILATLAGWPAAGQTAQTAQTADADPVAVSTEHPRLFLRPQRLRLLKRERDRSSMRWQQFAALVVGNAPLPELGFAEALYYQISGDANVAKEAIAFAIAPGADLRQMAIVYDWCQDVMTAAQKTTLATRMTRAMAATAADNSVGSVRSRALAAIALYDEVPQTPQKELERIVRIWWERDTVPALRAGKSPIGREDAYPLFELLHAIRDNTIIELRDSARQFFKDYPIEHLMTYYPAVYNGPDTDYYIGARPKIAEPDLNAAALSRAADFAMVAYDVNAAESQVLQGWLLHDKFILKGVFGAPYEFLWANPYLPGLSYYHVPLVYHNPESGKLFARSTWDASATWFGYYDGVMQLFQDGKLTNVTPRPEPLSIDQAVICFAHSAKQWRVKLGEDEEVVFLVGLKPRVTYEVEIDDEEMYEGSADAGGILPLTLIKGKEMGIRIRPVAAPQSR